MRCFPLKLLITLVLILPFQTIGAQNGHLNGLWQSSNQTFPQLFINKSASGLKIVAKGGFLKNDVEAVRFQQLTASSGSKLQVIFPVQNEEIVLNVRIIGKNLHAGWSSPAISEKILYTTYSKLEKTTAASSTLGVIKGQPVGKAKSIASIFHVSLYGPDNEKRFVSTQPLGAEGGFNFSSLPDGEYWMYVEARGSTIVKAYPSAQKIHVVNGSATVLNIELR